MPFRGHGWSKRGTKASRRAQQRRARRSRFYAVAVGRRPGIFNTWDDAYQQVYRYSGAVHKSFKTLEEAFVWMYDNRLSPPDIRELFPHVQDTVVPPQVFYEAYLQFWRQREAEEEEEDLNG